MLQWIQQNWGSIVILAVLALIVGVIVFFHFRAKKRGKNSCCGGCSQCAMNGLCHSRSDTKQEEQ